MRLTHRAKGRGNVTPSIRPESADFTSLHIPAYVLRWIARNAPMGATVLEFGGGKSTRELSKSFAVTTIDHDFTFVQGNGATLIQAALVDGYHERAKLQEVLRNQYDVVIIVGPPRGSARRGNVAWGSNDVRRIPLLARCWREKSNTTSEARRAWR